MRRVLSFVIASAMVGGGLYLASQATKGIALLGGASLVIFGLIWLLEDSADPGSQDKEPK